MTITSEMVLAEAGYGGSRELADRAVRTSQRLVDIFLGGSIVDVPEEIYDEAHLAVAVEIVNLSAAPNGVLMQQYADSAEAVPIRLSRDPMSPARPLLAPWVGGLTV